MVMAMEGFSLKKSKSPFVFEGRSGAEVLMGIRLDTDSLSPTGLKRRLKLVISWGKD